MHLCDSGGPEGVGPRLTLRAEAAGDAVVLAELGVLQVGAGVRAGRPALAVLHVEGARLGCREEMGHVSRPAPASGPRRDGMAGPGSHRALTAELGAPPVQGQPPGMGALAGVLSKGVTEAAGEVGLATVAEILPAGLHVAAGVHQRGTVQERLAAQHLLADALGQSRGTRSRLWNIPWLTAPSSACLRGRGSRTPPPFTLGLTKPVKQFTGVSGAGS